MREVVILSAARTPVGSFGGSLASLPAPRLGAAAIAEALQRSGIPREGVDEVYMGCVLSAGLGQAPARQAALFAGLPRSIPCTTINKVCGSGLKAVMLAAQAIAIGEADVVVAGGMESMSNAPYLLPNARFGYRLGEAKIIDSLIHDGLWDVYNDLHMGGCAEICAQKYHFTREEVDAFAIESYRRALDAQRKGETAEEIVSGLPISEDEEPKRVDFEKLKRLKPVFRSDGLTTAGNASSISDGAAALVISSASTAATRGFTPLARIIASASHAQDPQWFTTAPVEAIRKVLKKAGRSIAEIDLFEINEAFAVSSLAVYRDLDLDFARVNIRGGAIALGHPIGASGARVLTTLLYAMRDRGAKRGVAALCLGGGEAVAMLVERG